MRASSHRLRQRSFLGSRFLALRNNLRLPRYGRAADHHLILAIFQKRTLDCPKCTTPMEKTAGHMTCAGCKAHIYWVYMAVFERGPVTH
jgi:hypothetical protein